MYEIGRLAKIRTIITTSYEHGTAPADGRHRVVRAHDFKAGVELATLHATLRQLGDHHFDAITFFDALVLQHQKYQNAINFSCFVYFLCCFATVPLQTHAFCYRTVKPPLLFPLDPFLWDDEAQQCHKILFCSLSLLPCFWAAHSSSAESCCCIWSSKFLKI